MIGSNKKLNQALREQHVPFLSDTNNIFTARVKKIILDDKQYPDLFKELGDWNSIGTIFFEDVHNPNSNIEVEKNNFATPIYPNIKNYPLENELVYVIKLSSNTIQSNNSDVAYYYISPINVWNSIHHNAIPDNIWNSNLPESQQKDYIQTSDGNVRRVIDGGTEIKLGNTFKEKINIRSLLPFEGDLIYEGRFGNSIRFGSTVKSNTTNLWSETGNEGDPIIIIRNGQKQENKDPWIPILEDINEDKSNIYITSTQKIPLDASSIEYKSYNTSPIGIKEYNKPQILFSSGRLVFNSYDDSILFSSKKTINLNALETLNIDTKKGMIVNTSKILLGNKEATEPLLLGNKLTQLLKQLLQGVKELCDTLPTVGTPSPGTPNVAVINSSTKLSVITSQLLATLEDTKSKQNFTI